MGRGGSEEILYGAGVSPASRADLPLAESTMRCLAAETLGIEASELKGDQAFLIGDATPAYANEIELYLDGSFASRDAALGSIVSDGVNPLPVLLVDFEDPQEPEISLLAYDPVKGIQEPDPIRFAPFLLEQDDDHQQAIIDARDEVRHALGHFD